MIFTSYFAKVKKFPKNVIPVAICARAPAGYTGLRYSKLAPKYDMIRKYKDDYNEVDYIEGFNNTTLKYLNPLWVLGDLRALLIREGLDTPIPFWENPDSHVALICYERPDDFCHRHIVAEWFRNYGIECKEGEEQT